MKNKKPSFLLQRIYSDGSCDEPQIHEVKEVDNDWTMNRRGFLATAGIGVGVLGNLGLIGKVRAEVGDQCSEEIKAHSDAVYSLAFSPDGKLLASGSADGSIKLWTMPEAKLIRSLPGHLIASVNSLAFSPEGKLLALGNKEGMVKILAIPSGELVRTLSRHGAMIGSLAFSPDGKLLATGSSDKTINIWALPSGELVKTITENKSRVECVLFSPDGTLLASVSKDEITLRSVQSWTFLTSFPHYDVFSIAFSPDGRLLVSGSISKFETIRFWAMPSGKLIKALSDIGYSVRSFVFSRNGELLVYRLADKGIGVLKMPGKSLDSIRELSDFFLTAYMEKKPPIWGEISCFALAPDGKLLVSGLPNGTIKLRTMPEGKTLACLFDPSALRGDKKVNQYAETTADGTSITYTVPCGSKIPAGAVCTCNCVTGTGAVPKPAPTYSGSRGSRSYNPSSGGGRSYCSCNKVCTCVPIK